MSLPIDELKKSKNIAELLDAEELQEIGTKVLDTFKLDDDSRTEWKDLIDKAMSIAKQTLEAKNYPFPNSANIKYPLITRAAIDFAARTYPEMIQNTRVVKATVIGKDTDNKKADRASRVSQHMSFQLLKEMDNWEGNLDSLLHILPIMGTVFKKTYYNPLLKKPVSELCLPHKIVVNYSITSLEQARRISHILSFHKNDIIERIRSGLFCDIDLDCLIENEDNQQDEDSLVELIEQHCYLDLDDDGYQEPYIVTVHKATGKVLRIVSRFKTINKNSDNEIISITPENYFIDFHFIRSPDGGFYSVGLGTLLYPLNEAINTLINQLIDAGTLNNTQGGFLGKGLRLKNGDLNLRLGEWKVLDASSGTNLTQNIVPLPTKEPSQTLFQLLGFLTEAGKDLIFATDTLQGKGQTQNVASSTISMLVEQGMKIYNAINKRLYLALSKEYSKIYELNSKYLTQEQYQRVMDDERCQVKEDYDLEGLDIVPIADPNMASETQRLAKAQAIMSIPNVDPRTATINYLKALQIEDRLINLLVPKPDPNAPPPPEVLKTLAETKKFEADAKARIVEATVLSQSQMIDVEKLNVMKQDASTREAEAAARIIKMKQDATVNNIKATTAVNKAAHNAVMNEVDAKFNKEKTNMELTLQGLDIQKDIMIKKIEHENKPTE